MRRWLTKLLLFIWRRQPDKGYRGQVVEPGTVHLFEMAARGEITPEEAARIMMERDDRAGR